MCPFPHQESKEIPQRIIEYLEIGTTFLKLKTTGGDQNVVLQPTMLIFWDPNHATPQPSQGW